MSRSNQRKKAPIDATGAQYKEFNSRISKPQSLKPKSISFKTPNQQHYYNTIMENQITIATGPAGTAKTFLACYAALVLLAENEIDEIIITKPAVEIGKSLGALPGNLDEKMEPYVLSITDCFNQLIGMEQTNNLIYSKKKIKILPLQMIRGLTLDNCFVICDEAQNADYVQLKALLTRLGEDATLVINGDCAQTDLKDTTGLPHAMRVLEDIDGVGIVEFGIDDIVRSGIVKDIIISYMAYEKKNKGKL